jgi:tubulin-specific chaperone D
LRSPPGYSVPCAFPPPPIPQLTRYQEQPQLLDGYLEDIVQPLASLLRDQAAAAASAAPPPGAAPAGGAPAAAAAAGGVDVAAVCGVCRLLHVVVSVRGHKTVVRFFPHEAADLERALQVVHAARPDRVFSFFIGWGILGVWGRLLFL